MKLIPVVKALGGCKKLILSPLAHYWCALCCNQERHISNYNEPSFLTSLNHALHSLHDSVRDSIYSSYKSNFRVLCFDRMLGLKALSASVSGEDILELAALWGNNLFILQET